MLSPPAQDISLRRRVHQLINNPIADIVVIGLILLSVVLIILEQSVSGRFKPWLEFSNHILTALFTMELCLRFVGEKHKSRFFRRYWFDILAVLAPLYRSLRILRILRLLRVFRMGKLLNRRFNTVQSWVHYGIFQHFWLIFVLLTLVVAGAVSFHIAEPKNPEITSFKDAIWWSLFTLIGGEPLTGSPAVTTGGRLISLFVIIAGLITFAVLTGIVAAVMINRLKPQMERGDMDIDELDNHIVICGWNRSANLMINVLQSSEEYKGCGIVLLAEFDEGQPDTLVDEHRVNLSNLYVLKGDFTRMDLLEKANITRASEAIILADNLKSRSDQDRDARTILAAMLIEKMNPKIFTCVELLNRDNAAHLRMFGVEEILVADDYTGTILANAQRTRGIISMLDELFDPGQGNQFYKTPVPEAWFNKTVGDIHTTLKEEFDAILISLEPAGSPKDGNGIIVNPTKDQRLQQGDRLVLIAPKMLDFRHLA